jgi:hypothetical protein
VDPLLWTPDVAEIERHIPTRGPFTTTSVPTVAQVQSLAVSIARNLLLEVGETTVLTPAQIDGARSYVEHATAARVEWGWYPEQQDQDSAGRQQDAWAGMELARLRKALGTATPVAAAQWSFPDPTPRVW